LYKPGTSYIYEFQSQLFLISTYLKGSILKYQLEQENNETKFQFPEEDLEESNAGREFFYSLNSQNTSYNNNLLIPSINYTSETNKQLLSTNYYPTPYSALKYNNNIFKSNDFYSLNLF
jgi:hypothetical protein